MCICSVSPHLFVKDMRMATVTRYGQIQEFRAENDSITAYFERVEMYFTANDIADDKQVPVLLSSIGAKIYELLRSLVAP